MSLFLCGHSAEMRETEGNSAGGGGGEQRHGNEFIYVQNSAEMRETEGNHVLKHLYL